MKTLTMIVTGLVALLGCMSVDKKLAEKDVSEIRELAKQAVEDWNTNSLPDYKCLAMQSSVVLKIIELKPVYESGYTFMFSGYELAEAFIYKNCKSETDRNKIKIMTAMMFTQIDSIILTKKIKGSRHAGWVIDAYCDAVLSEIAKLSCL